MKEVTIVRADAVALFAALGFKTAGKWAKGRMIDKLKDLAGMVQDGGISVPEDEDDAERLNKMLKKIAGAKGAVNVVASLPDESEELEDDFTEEEHAEMLEEELEEEEEEQKPAKAKRAKKARTKASAEEDEQEEQSAAEENGKDRFGYRKGTKVSRFLACLSTKPKTVEMLCEEAGVKQQRGSLPGLIEQGIVVKEGRTYRLS